MPLAKALVRRGFGLAHPLLQTNGSSAGHLRVMTARRHGNNHSLKPASGKSAKASRDTGWQVRHSCQYWHPEDNNDANLSLSPHYSDKMQKKRYMVWILRRIDSASSNASSCDLAQCKSPVRQATFADLKITPYSAFFAFCPKNADSSDQKLTFAMSIRDSWRRQLHVGLAPGTFHQKRSSRSNRQIHALGQALLRSQSCYSLF